MKKEELISAIKESGIEVSGRLSKDDLQVIYDNIQAQNEPPTSNTGDTTEQPEVKEDSGEPHNNDAFDDLASKINGAQAPEPKEPEEKPLIEKTTRKRKKTDSAPDSFHVEGYVLLLITDTAFPFALAGINNLLDKRIKIQSHDLQLSETDFKKLEPLADQAAAYMTVNLNPIAGFAIVAAFMYGNNLLNMRFEIEKSLKK